MSVPSPVKCWTKAEARLAEAITNSAGFQTMTGTSSAAAAAAWAFGESLDEPLLGDAFSPEERLDRYPHYCQVYSDPNAPYGKRRTDTRHYWAYGQAITFFEQHVSEAERDALELPQAVERAWKITIETIIDEVLAWLETEGGLVVLGVEVSDGPGTNPQEEWKQHGVWQGCELVWEWGPAGA